MGRRKSAKHAQIRPWLSAKPDCEEGRFIQVGNSLLLSKEFQNLNASAKILYFDMAMESGGKQFFTFSHGTAKDKYGIASTSFERAAKELINAGFIVLDLDDDRAQFKANTFRFSNAWKSKRAPHFGEGNG